ncbi:MAG: hypothetical protein JJU36_12580, partial [Phycisphaeraceae bacterium]|nr:hypothetical protein [Phycisphaeraceae bacterium]
RVIHADLTTTEASLKGADRDVASARDVRIQLSHNGPGTIHARELQFADSMWPDIEVTTHRTDDGWKLWGQWELEPGIAIALTGRLDDRCRHGAPRGFVRAELPETRLNRSIGDTSAQETTGATTVGRFAQLEGWDFFGAVGAWAQVDFGPQGTTHRGEVNFERLHGELSSQQPDEGHRARFFGLSGKMTLSSLFPLQTQGTQRLALRALMLELPGFPRMEQFADLEAHYRLGGEDGVFIEQAHASWVEYRWRGRGRYGRSDPIIDRLYREGNRISAYALQIEPNASGFDTTLHLQNFNLFALLEGITDGKVRGGGRLTGRITLGFEGGNWRWPQAMLVAEPQDRLTPEPVTSGEDAHQLRYQGSYRVSDPQLKFIILDSARSAIRTHPNRSIIMGILDNALDQFNYTSLEVRSFGSGDSGRLIFTGYGRTRDDDIGMQDHRIDLRLSADVVRRILRLGDTD